MRLVERAAQEGDDEDGEEGNPEAELPEELARNLLVVGVGPGVVDRADVAASGEGGRQLAAGVGGVEGCTLALAAEARRGAMTDGWGVEWLLTAGCRAAGRNAYA